MNTSEKVANIEFGRGEAASPAESSGQIISRAERQDSKLRFRGQIQGICRPQNPADRPIPAAYQDSVHRSVTFNSKGNIQKATKFYRNGLPVLDVWEEETPA